MSKKRKNREQSEESIKIILLGNTQVGKTSIIDKFEKNIFLNTTMSTIGSNFIIKFLNINGENVKIELWDTAGQEKFRALSKLFVKNSKIVILVYDITSQESFIGLNFWHEFLINELDQNIVLGLVGNKADLYEKEEVSQKEGKECAEKWGANFTLLSAKEDKEGIDNYIIGLVKKYLEKKNELEEEKNNNIKIKKHKAKKENHECCGGGKNKKEKFIKIAFLGPKGVGKEDIIQAIKGKEIIEKNEQSKKIISYILEDKRKVHAFLVDTNGDNDKDSEMEMILKESKIFFLVFDYKDENSFKEIENIYKKIPVNDKEKKYINILGNKTNLTKEEKESKINEQAQEFAQKNDIHYESFSMEEISNIQGLIKNNINKCII